MPGILLTIDFEKAFDSLKWGFLNKCLQAFNFGQRFRSYVDVLYNEMSAAVLNNGHISRWFYPEKGVRQGGPLSPYLFNLAVETLSCKIRDSENVQGIQIENWEIKKTISWWYHLLRERQNLPTPPNRHFQTISELCWVENECRQNQIKNPRPWTYVSWWPVWTRLDRRCSKYTWGGIIRKRNGPLYT